MNRRHLTDREVEATLSRVDWNFTGSTTDSQSVHALHFFPGSFLPQIPFFLIQALSEHGSIVMDPFAGSGTAGIEAMRLGRRAWMSDISTAGVEVMKGKFALLSSRQVVARLENILESLTWDFMLHHSRISRGTAGTHPDLRLWYSSGTLAQLECLWAVIEREQDKSTREVLRMLFADTLFTCASMTGSKTSTGKLRKHHWGWIADNVKPLHPTEHDAIGKFRDRVVRALRIAETHPKIDPVGSWIRRMSATALEINDSSVDLVVTSPPYVSMNDYTHANRLTYLWMNWDMTTERKSEIGARYRRKRKRALEEYTDELLVTWKEILRVLRPGGICAIVMGASRKYPCATENLISHLSTTACKIAGPFARQSTRRRLGDRAGISPREYVIAFRK